MNFPIVGDELKQSSIMLGCPANCPAEIPAAVQDYSDVIRPKSSVLSGSDFDGEERHCVPFLSPEKVELPQRGERVGMRRWGTIPWSCSVIAVLSAPLSLLCFPRVMQFWPWEKPHWIVLLFPGLGLPQGERAQGNAASP